jgi:hypothetical protein
VVKRFRANRLAFGLLCVIPPALNAQGVVDASLVAAVGVLGEWHLGITQAPSDLHDSVTDGRKRALGLAFPLQVAPHWQLRPRYDDGLFSRAQVLQGAYGAATVAVAVKQRHLGLDALWAPVARRSAMARPFVYVGAGLGVMQTWHERELTGYVGGSGLPQPGREESWSAAGRVLTGLQVHPALGVELQFQTSSHTFEGRRYRDTCATFGVRIWPAVLITGRPFLRGN